MTGLRQLWPSSWAFDIPGVSGASLPLGVSVAGRSVHGSALHAPGCALRAPRAKLYLDAGSGYVWTLERSPSGAYRDYAAPMTPGLEAVAGRRRSPGEPLGCAFLLLLLRRFHPRNRWAEDSVSLKLLPLYNVEEVAAKVAQLTLREQGLAPCPRAGGWPPRLGRSCG